MPFPFLNTAKPIERRHEGHWSWYGYDRPSVYLFPWSRLFQIVLSQAGSYLLTKKFHVEMSGIYRAEGGVNLPGVGELVLHADLCHFDEVSSGLEVRDPSYRIAGLITNVVLAWDPNDPIESLLLHAAVNTNCEVKKLREAVLAAPRIGGDPLRGFFDYCDTFVPQPEYAAFALPLIWPPTAESADA